MTPSLEITQHNTNAPDPVTRMGHGDSLDVPSVQHAVPEDHPLARLAAPGITRHFAAKIAREIIAKSNNVEPWRRAQSLEWRKLTNASIYVFACCGLHKIGFSENPDKRLLDLQAACPFEIRCIYASRPLRNPYAKWAESLCHHALSDFRERREWFRVSAAHALPIVSAARRLANDAQDADRVYISRIRAGDAPSWISAR